MSDEKRKVTSAEDDLSSMIEAYEQKDELRNKINELKKQKEIEKEKERLLEEQNRAQEEARSALFGKEEPKKEETIEQTRVDFNGSMFQDSLENEKTTVIMGGGNYRDFSDESNFDPSMKEEEVFNVREASEEEAEDESEYEEFSETELESLAPKKEKMDDTKLNRIITGVIAVIAGLIVIAGIVLALNFFGGGEKDQDKTTVEPPKEETPNVDNSDTENEEKPVEKDPENIGTDNSVKIAEIKGYISDYEAKLANAETNYETKKKEKELADQAKKEASEALSTMKKEVEKINIQYDSFVEEHKASEEHKTGSCNKGQPTDSSQSCERITELENKRATELAKYDIASAEKAYQDAVNKADEANINQLTAKDDVKNLELEISDLKKQLEELQK